MKILIDVILTEFNRAGYQKEEVEDVLFLKHKENHDFWICTKSFDLEHQHELFEKAINFWKQHKESEKNISVLIPLFLKLLASFIGIFISSTIGTIKTSATDFLSAFIRFNSFSL